jgi:hypothetical protein
MFSAIVSAHNAPSRRTMDQSPTRERLRGVWQSTPIGTPCEKGSGLVEFRLLIGRGAAATDAAHSTSAVTGVLVA